MARKSDETPKQRTQRWKFLAEHGFVEVDREEGGTSYVYDEDSDAEALMGLSPATWEVVRPLIIKGKIRPVKAAA